MADAMSEAFLKGAKLSVEQQAAQVAAAVADLEKQGFNKIKGPIMQLAQTKSKPGRRDDLLRVLAKFEQHVKHEGGTLLYGQYPDLHDPDLVHCVQIYESWDALRHHMVDPSYFQYLDDILEASDPTALKYFYGSTMFDHWGKGHGK
jgi:quinol monooxygenase YgiN